MLDKVILRTNEYIENMPKKERKKYGQFFTSKETARFMAGLFSVDDDKRTISVLDAGAGSGILSCAFLERLSKNEKICAIELTCYENDEKILGLLKENLEYCKSHIFLFASMGLFNMKRSWLGRRRSGSRRCRIT